MEIYPGRYQRVLLKENSTYLLALILFIEQNWKLQLYIALSHVKFIIFRGQAVFICNLSVLLYQNYFPSLSITGLADLQEYVQVLTEIRKVSKITEVTIYKSVLYIHNYFCFLLIGTIEYICCLVKILLEYQEAGQRPIVKSGFFWRRQPPYEHDPITFFDFFSCRLLSVGKGIQIIRPKNTKNAQFHVQFTLKGSF